MTSSIYTAHYQQGTVNTDENNVHTDTVTNSRPGIRIEKKDWEEKLLSGAVFTLKDGVGRDIGQATYTSDQTGLVTIAYLPVGTFILTEIESPKGYTGKADPITIIKHADGHVTVSCTGSEIKDWSYTELTDTTDGVITVKNKPFTLTAVKVDAKDVETPLPGVHFALYGQIQATGGNLIRDYYPISGYEDLVSDKDGIIPNDTQELPSGVYYLRETQALPEYSPIDTDVCFEITPMGTVNLQNPDNLSDRECTAEEKNNDNIIHYTLKIRNAESWQKIRIVKVDIGNPLMTLSDAEFDLYRVIEGKREDTALYTNLTSGNDGILRYIKEDTTYDMLDLPVGVYHLIETRAPAGYTVKTSPVTITVTSTSVIYDEGTTLSQSGSGITWNSDSKVYTMKVSNTPGVELPATGGFGTLIYTVSGISLILLAGISS